MFLEQFRVSEANVARYPSNQTSNEVIATESDSVRSVFRNARSKRL